MTTESRLRTLVALAASGSVRGAASRLTVTESGFAQLPVNIRRETYESHRDGWSRELSELVEHLNGA